MEGQRVCRDTSDSETELPNRHSRRPNISLKRVIASGPYEIVEWLDAGGMVRSTWPDPQVGREVAIKILPAQFSTDPDRLRRFEQEVRPAV